MVADISERKRMEAALRESEDRFKRLAENAPDVIYRLRLWPTPAVEYVNRAIEVIGHSPEEFLADPGLLPRLIHPGDRHVMEATFRGELSAMQPSRVRWVRDDGSIVWTEIHSVAVRDSEGRVVAVEGISRDVTGRVAAEEILRETREQLLQAQKLRGGGPPGGRRGPRLQQHPRGHPRPRASSSLRKPLGDEAPAAKLARDPERPRTGRRA